MTQLRFPRRTKYEPGDIVCIVANDYMKRANPSMKKTIGREGIVTSVSEADSWYCVRFADGTGWYYPPDALTRGKPPLPGHGPENQHLAQELPR